MVESGHPNLQDWGGVRLLKGVIKPVGLLDLSLFMMQQAQCQFRGLTEFLGEQG